MPGTIATGLADGVLSVTLNRPEQLNALSFAMQQELADTWAAAQDEPEVRCVLVTGAGRAFCAGADLADLAAMTAPRRPGTERIEFCPAASLAEVVADGDLGTRAREIAASIAAQSPAAVRATVAALRRQHRAALGDQVARAWSEVGQQQMHPDAAEGGRALTEGRAPRWTGPGDGPERRDHDPAGR